MSDSRRWRKLSLLQDSRRGAALSLGWTAYLARPGREVSPAIAPIWTGHADFANPFEFITFLRAARDLEFDVMLESKSKDLALIRLRNDLLRYAPDVALRFGLRQEQAAEFERDQQETMELEKPSAA